MTLSLLSIFAAGLLTFVSPCVLPLIPVYLATIAGTSLATANARRTLLVAFAFTAGLSSVFVVLGALASALGGLLVEHRTLVVVASGLLMVLFGLRALGVLRVAAFDRDVRPGLEHVKAASSVLGAFLFGAAFALGWSPCVGPVLASVLTYVATHADSPWKGAGYLAVYAAGLSVPLLLVASAASRATSLVRRYRGLIPRLEKVTGVALVAVGVFAVFGALRATDLSDSPSATAEVAVSPAPGKAPVEAAACDPASAQGSTCDLPAVTRQDDSAATGTEAEPNLLVGSQLLEFTAHQCPVCRRMRPVIDRVAHTCDGLGGRVVRVDVTTPRGRKLADRHAVRGTPTFVFVDDAGIERARIIGEQSEQEVAATVERALQVSCRATPARVNSPG